MAPRRERAAGTRRRAVTRGGMLCRPVRRGRQRFTVASQRYYTTYARDTLRYTSDLQPSSTSEIHDLTEMSLETEGISIDARQLWRAQGCQQVEATRQVYWQVNVFV